MATSMSFMHDTFKVRVRVRVRVRGRGRVRVRVRVRVSAPFMKGYCGGASETSVHTTMAHRPSHASQPTQFVHAKSEAVPP